MQTKPGVCRVPQVRCRFCAALCREQACLFRLLWFCRYLPVGIPQKMYRYNVGAPLKRHLPLQGEDNLATPQSTASTAPLTQGSQVVRRCCRARLPPLCKGRWIGLGRDGGVAFSVAHEHYTNTFFALARYRGRGGNRGMRAGNARPYKSCFMFRPCP